MFARRFSPWFAVGSGVALALANLAVYEVYVMGSRNGGATVLYHVIGAANLDFKLACAAAAAAICFLPVNRMMRLGLVCIVAASLANFAAAFLWPGVPDFLPVGPITANTGDAMSLLGEMFLFSGAVVLGLRGREGTGWR